VAGLECLEDVDEDPLGPTLERTAAEGIVGPMHREDAPHAEATSVADAAVDVASRALRDTHLLAAAEQGRGLDSDDHRQPALLDREARLPRVVDEPEPALALAARLSVDVALQPAERLDLLAHGLGLVA
jgi:hypothetical protein